VGPGRPAASPAAGVGRNACRGETDMRVGWVVVQIRGRPRAAYRSQRSWKG
jgi:hypothetical protein